MLWLIPCEALNVQAAIFPDGQNPTVCLFSFDWNGSLGNVNALLLGFRQWRIVRSFKSNILLYSRKTQRRSHPKLPKELSQEDVVSCSTLEFPVDPLRIQMTMQICRKLKKSPSSSSVCRPIVCLLSRTCCLLLLMEILTNVREVFDPILLLHLLPSLLWCWVICL